MGQDDEVKDAWAPLRFLIGSWEGTGEGQPGVGSHERMYELVLEDKFLHVRNESTYEPQESNPEGEVHQDWGFFSYDQNRNKFVLREFHVEGFVNQYVLDEVAPDSRKLVFLTESIENIPPGWRARETYEILGKDEFRETFDLAAPGKELSCYIENHFRRKR